MESNTWCPRLTAAMILSGSAVQEKGFGLSLVSATKRLIAAWSSTTHRKTPRFSRCLARADSDGFRHHRCSPMGRLNVRISPGERYYTHGDIQTERWDARRSGLVAQQAGIASLHEAFLPAPHTRRKTPYSRSAPKGG